MKELKTLVIFCIIIVLSATPVCAKNDVQTDEMYKVRSELLMRASNEAGVITPEDAACVWAEGLMKRSAALQYIVMTDRLKEKYSKDLEITAPNWVTGVSSPWVSGYKILYTKTDKKALVKVFINIDTKAVNYTKSYKAELTIICENGFYRISNIKCSKDLLAYTGFQDNIHLK